MENPKIKKVKIIGECGLNHNADINIAKQLMIIAKGAGCDYVKFQKRNPDISTPENQKNQIKSTPWGEITYLEYKHIIEFGKYEYEKLFEFAEELDIGIFASVWDKDSVDFMAEFTNIGKIPSAHLTNFELINYARKKFKILLMSTGMSTEEEIEMGVAVGEPDVLFHTNSTYPSPVEELNLNYILHLREKYPNIEIGYSGHEYGLVTTFATIPLGVTWVERHITLDRTLWGSDQKSSIEPSGLFKLVKGIRDIEKAISLPRGERILFESELIKRKTLSHK